MNTGRKDDTGKHRFSLIPLSALQEVIAVLEYGAQKYGADNWKKVPDFDDRYFNAAMRHLIEHRRGTLIDPETDRAHLAHAICCLLFLLAGPERKGKTLLTSTPWTDEDWAKIGEVNPAYQSGWCPDCGGPLVTVFEQDNGTATPMDIKSKTLCPKCKKEVS